MSELSTVDLGAILELAVLALTDGTTSQFRVVGSVPKWWTDEVGTIDDDGLVTIESPFLLDFLQDAREVWSGSEDKELGSAFFEIGDYQKRMPIQAVAVQHQQQNLLLVRNLSEWLSDLLQTARHNLIDQEKSRSTHRNEVHSLTSERDEAQRREELTSRVLANMSHEIRTPLTTILGMVSLASESDKKESEHLKAISSAADHLLNLGNDILDLSKMQVQHLELDRQAFSLVNFMNDMQAAWTLQTEKRGIHFELDISDDVPSEVFGDAFRLRQVLSNLVGNAMKFTEQGSVKVSVSKSLVSKDAIGFVIQDTGVGIAEEDLPMIFEAFTQVDASKRRRHEGAGLGLAIAGRLVRLMGGEIKVRSELGVGTRFWFDIDVLSNDNDQTTSASSKAEQPSANACDGLRILVAEDHETNRSIIVEVLKSAGGNIVQVSNGADAIEAWRKDAFDLIVMDCNMPGVSGLEAIEVIREEEQSDARIPILALTAYAMQDEVQAIMDKGANRYFTKPFERQDLVSAVLETVKE